MNPPANRRSRLAVSALALGALAIILPMLGGLGTRAGVWSWPIGLLLTPLGLLVAVIGLLLGAVALLRLRKTGHAPGAAVAGTGISAMSFLYLGYLVALSFILPRIHNISTDIEDPPEFTMAASLRGEGDNPLFYDSEVIGPVQREAFPGLGPLELDLPPRRVYELARGALLDMGLELVREAPEQGEIEAVATTFWFGFKDDVVVRLRATDPGTRMDVRSVSRVGIGDFNANADRISEIIERVEQSR